MEMDRRGTTFYYPTQKGKAILEQAGVEADQTEVRYKNRMMSILESNKEFAKGLRQLLEQVEPQSSFEPLVFVVRAQQGADGDAPGWVF
jgi:hypothetical protein